MDHIYTLIKSPDGKTWVIMAIDGNAAMGIGTEGGQLIQRWAGEDESAFGTTNLYHPLQREKFKPSGVTALHYHEFVALLGAVGIKPETMDALLAQPTPPELLYCEYLEAPAMR